MPIAKQPSRAKWSRSLETLPAISVQQPFAWLIIHCGKDVENRTRRTHHRGPILIHAPKTVQRLSEARRKTIEKRIGRPLPEEFQTGGVVGMVDLIDCLRTSKSPWKQAGFWGYVLERPRTLAFKPCKGTQGLRALRLS